LLPLTRDLLSERVARRRRKFENDLGPLTQRRLVEVSERRIALRPVQSEVALIGVSPWRGRWMTFRDFDHRLKLLVQQVSNQVNTHLGRRKLLSRKVWRELFEAAVGRPEGELDHLRLAEFRAPCLSHKLRGQVQRLGDLRSRGVIDDSHMNGALA